MKLLIDYFRKKSIVIQVSTLVFMVLVLLISPIFLFIYNTQNSNVDQSKLNSLYQVSNLLNRSIEYPMMSGDMEAVDIILENAAGEETVLGIDLLNMDLEEFTSTRNESLPVLSDEGLMAALQNGDEVVDRSRYQQGDVTLYDPILYSEDCLDCHDGTAGDLSGVLRTSITTKEVLVQAKQTRSTMLLLGILSLVVISILLLIIIKQLVVKPLSNVIHSLQDIAEGEGDLTQRLRLKSENELGDLATWFNTFVEKIHSVVSEVKISAQHVTSAVRQISAVSEELASGSEQQQSQTSEVATSMEEMAATILQSSTNTNSASHSAQKAAEVAGNGGDIVQQTISGMERISEAVRSSAQRIEELGRQSEEIGKIIAVIDDIADQTNLLALNANIEAARAGDQGRGFAVVADEVRVLAERTTKATAEIAEMIAGIQNSTTTAVDAMSDGIREVDTGVDMAGKAGGALEEIITMVQEVDGLINQVATAAQEQSTGAEEISANVEGISTVTKQSASSAQSMASSAQELNHEVENLDKLISQFII